MNFCEAEIFQSFDLAVILCIHASFSVVVSVNFRLPLFMLGFSDGDTSFSVVDFTEIVAGFSILFHRASVNSISHFNVSFG
ncbi:hypothetical protein IKN40_01270 [bacterium]|nr:hypothetical protein [bacterium]